MATAESSPYANLFESDFQSKFQAKLALAKVQHKPAMSYFITDLKKCVDVDNDNNDLHWLSSSFYGRSVQSDDYMATSIEFIKELNSSNIVELFKANGVNLRISPELESFNLQGRLGCYFRVKFDANDFITPILTVTFLQPTPEFV